METVSECELNCLELCINSLSSRLSNIINENTTTPLQARDYEMKNATDDIYVGVVTISERLSSLNIKVLTDGRVEGDIIYFIGTGEEIGRIIVKDTAHNRSCVYSFSYTESGGNGMESSGNDDLLSEIRENRYISFEFK